MSPERYSIYLETLVVSLLHERNSQEDIDSTDAHAPVFASGYSFSPINIREAITKAREERGITHSDEIAIQFFETADKTLITQLSTKQFLLKDNVIQEKILKDDWVDGRTWKREEVTIHIPKFLQSSNPKAARKTPEKT